MASGIQHRRRREVLLSLLSEVKAESELLLSGNQPLRWSAALLSLSACRVGNFLKLTLLRLSCGILVKTSQICDSFLGCPAIVI